MGDDLVMTRVSFAAARRDGCACAEEAASLSSFGTGFDGQKYAAIFTASIVLAKSWLQW
jgi:hypothetical protein